MLHHPSLESPVPSAIVKSAAFLSSTRAVRTCWTALVTTILLLAPAHTRAQSTSTASVSLPDASAAPATGVITIDGILDESSWSRATPIKDFHQQQPNEGAAPSQATEVR